MSSKLKVGLFQTIETTVDKDAASITIHDELHGTHTISEPVILAVLTSPFFRRLATIGQHGISNLLSVNPCVTRFEHSVGAFLIVRKAGAALDEQLAALLHDVSHTVLSHDVDWALSEPGESYHEVQKDRFLAMTDLPAILTAHGFQDLKPFHEELFPLVEWPSPHLCADRLDYAVRDSTSFGLLALEDARRILASVQAHPSSSSPDRFLVLDNQDLALILARAYLAADRDIWSHPSHVAMSTQVGSLIAAVIKSGRIQEEQLWKMSDREFWDTLRAVADPAEVDVMNRLESVQLTDGAGLRLPKAAKVRTLDPDVFSPATAGAPTPLSQLDPAWAQERQTYIEARQALREQT
jgi:HD superfamily phosphohydrolase